MRSPSTPLDTSPDALRAQTRALRELGPAGRLAAGLRYSARLIALTRAAIAARHPDADEDELLILWVEHAYGHELAAAVRAHQERVGRTRTTTSR